MTSRVALETEADRLSRLYAAQSRINQAIVRLPTRKELFVRVCQVLVENGGFTMAWIGWHNDVTQIIEPVARWGDDHDYVDAITIYSDGRQNGGGPTATAFVTGRVAVSNDVRIDPVMLPWQDAIAGTTYRSTAALPIRESDHVHGTLNVYSDEPDFFQDKEVALLQEAAIDVSFGLDNLSRERSRLGAEAALRESESRYRSLFEHMLEGYAQCEAIFEHDTMQDFRYVAVNEAFATLTGLHDVVGKCVSEVLPGFAEVSPELMAMYARVTRSGVPERTEAFIDGLQLWLSISAYSSDPKHFVVVFDNVTERKRADLKIAEQAGLLDQARDAIFVRDLEHRITYWSQGAERVFGWTPEEACGRLADELLGPDGHAFHAASEAVRVTGAWSGELNKVTKAGAAVVVESRWTLVRDADGQPTGILGIDTDITERKKLEVQFLRAQRMESIGTLAGGIAHDLNNVFAPIVMSLEMLKADAVDPAAIELIDVIASSAQRGAAMVKQVLQFARGVEGLRVAVEVKQLLRDVERIIRDTFPKNIQLRVVAPGELNPVLGDPTQLHQVLMNLCVNARDAMPIGGVMVLSAENVTIDEHYAALDTEAQAGEYVLLQVEDDGTGMPVEMIAKIFDPFFTTKEVGKGTGLGLSTSLAIVKSHGGFLRVYSELGKGSKFKLYFPAHVGPVPEAAVQAPVLLPRGNGELILVVDDEPAVREITRQTLETFGYRVLVAADGAEAVAIFAGRKEEIAGVLTDMMMPVMDGPATIAVLRRLQPDVRIIAASGLNADSHVAYTVRLGVKHFLPKPYTAQTLLTALRDTLAAPPPGGSPGETT